MAFAKSEASETDASVIEAETSEAPAPPAIDIDRSLDSIFPSESSGGATDIDSRNTHGENRIYPELLLHQSRKGNKYYTALQKYSKQFIEDDNTIVRFSQSRLSHLMSSTINGWDETAPDTRLKESSPHSGSAASSLFSWSSGDKYIAARRLELRRKHENSEVVKVPSRESPPTPSSARAKFTSSQRLHSIVERESNKFIQDRIEVIKAHHMKQASERISQRKRDDHEMHLRRLKLKEEKYEKALKAAIASQNTRRNTGFFGALFGQKQVSNSFTLDLIDADPYVPSAAAKKPVTPDLSLSPEPSSPIDSIASSSHFTGSPRPVLGTPDILDESSADNELIFDSTMPLEVPTQNGSADLLVL